MTEHEYSSENNGLLQSVVQMMRALMEGAAQDRKIASEDRRALHEAVHTERRERTASLDRVHGRIDDLTATMQRVESGVGTIAEQLRQADEKMRSDIAAEAKRPRFALLDGTGARVLIGAAAAVLGAILAKTGWLPDWL